MLLQRPPLPVSLCYHLQQERVSILLNLWMISIGMWEYLEVYRFLDSVTTMSHRPSRVGAQNCGVPSDRAIYASLVV